MAVVALKSLAITNRDATPQVKNSSYLEAGIVRSSQATIELANGDSIASTYRLLEIPSNCSVLSLKLFCDAITSGTADFGLYQTTANGGLVVDADFFASAQAISAASAVGIEVAHEATGTYDIDDVEKPLWVTMGLASDPGITYDVVMTLTAATTAAGTVTLKGLFTI